MTLPNLGEEVTANIKVEFGDAGQRALDFLQGAFDLLNSDFDTPMRPEMVAFSIREALKSLIDSMAPVDGAGGGWAPRSRAVVAAHDSWKQSLTLSSEEQGIAASALSESIRHMAEVHDQDNLNLRRLIAVVIDRTGSVPSAQGRELIEAYSDLVGEASSSLHTRTTITSVTTSWSKTIELLDALFLPASARTERLRELASITTPNEEDLARLRQLMVVPGNFELFLSQLTSTEWLAVLEGDHLLEPPDTQSWWVGHALVRALKDTHAAEISGLLARLLGRAGKSVHSIYSLAWAAHDVGVHGREVLLDCLRRQPVPVAHLAISAIDQSRPDDPFVDAVADIVLNRATVEADQMSDSLLEAIVSGVGESNHHGRVELLVNKLRQFKDKGHWFGFDLERGVSVADERRFRADQADLKLAFTLCQVLARSMPFEDTQRLLDSTANLPTKLRARVAPWVLANAPAASVDQIVAEVELGLETRLASADDIAMVDRMAQHGNCVDRIRALYGPPPALPDPETVRVGQVPKPTLYRNSWSPLFDAEVSEAWRPVLDQIAQRFGRVSRESILSRGMTEMVPSQSPIAFDSLSRLSASDLLATARDWRPGPEDWLNSANDLAEAVVRVMGQNIDLWSEDPVGTVTALVHPTYISRYLRMLSNNFDAVDLADARLGSLVELMFAEPWPVEVLGDEGPWDYDETWEPAKSEAIELVARLATTDAGVGESADEIIDQLSTLLSGTAVRDAGDERDAFERGFGRPPAEALRAILDIAGWDHRNQKPLREAIRTALDDVLTAEGETSIQLRAVLATRLPLLSAIAPEWLDSSFAALFSDDEKGQAALDAAIRWASSSERLFRERSSGIWDAVDRGVENALDKAVTAMLWGQVGFSPAQVGRALKARDLLSQGGEAIGRLLSGSEELAESVIESAVEFWRTAITSHGSDPLSGFGWFALIKQIDYETLAELLLETLELSTAPLAASYQVSKRLAGTTPSERVLSVFDRMVRRQSHSFDQHMINATAQQVLSASFALAGTTAFQRLQNALQERNLLAQ